MDALNRRAFLGVFGASVAAIAIDPDRLLWTPGRKSYHVVSRPFAVGDFLYRPAGSPRWGRVQSYDAVRVGGEFGIYDGSRVQNNGAITSTCDYAGSRFLTTHSTLWQINQGI